MFKNENGNIKKRILHVPNTVMVPRNCIRSIKARPTICDLRTSGMCHARPRTSPNSPGVKMPSEMPRSSDLIEWRYRTSASTRLSIKCHLMIRTPRLQGTRSSANAKKIGDACLMAIRTFLHSTM